MRTTLVRHPDWEGSRWWRSGTAPSPEPAEPPFGAGAEPSFRNCIVTARRCSRPSAEEDRPARRPSTGGPLICSDPYFLFNVIRSKVAPLKRRLSDTVAAVE